LALAHPAEASHGWRDLLTPRARRVASLEESPDAEVEIAEQIEGR
jgi:hypothetical protein